MEVFEAIKKRHSCRNYKPEAVPEEKLNRILEAARLAPSAHNEQEWKLIVVRDVKKRREVAEAAGQSFVQGAPVIIAAVATHPENLMSLSSGNPAYAIDLAITVEHIALQATEEGLGTCWIGAFSQEGVKKVLGVPEEYKVVALMSLGYPADRGKPKSRKSLEEIVSFDKFES
jgi:nitroreductase